MDETIHLSPSQARTGFVRRYDTYSCSLRVPPTLADAISTRGVTDVGAVPGLVVAVVYDLYVHLLTDL